MRFFRIKHDEENRSIERKWEREWMSESTTTTTKTTDDRRPTRRRRRLGGGWWRSLGSRVSLFPFSVSLSLSLSLFFSDVVVRRSIESVTFLWIEPFLIFFWLIVLFVRIVLPCERKKVEHRYSLFFGIIIFVLDSLNRSTYERIWGLKTIQIAYKIIHIKRRERRRSINVPSRK